MRTFIVFTRSTVFQALRRKMKSAKSLYFKRPLCEANAVLEVLTDERGKDHPIAAVSGGRRDLEAPASLSPGLSGGTHAEPRARRSSGKGGPAQTS